MKVTVVGMGYVGLSNAVLLAQQNDVMALDILPEKVAMINKRISPFRDAEVEEYLTSKPLKLTATTDKRRAYEGAEYVIIAVPTDYDAEKGRFDTGRIEAVMTDVLTINPETIMVIRSTVPVGYTKGMRIRLGTDNIIFVPEFLREGMALYDNLYPSRIIVGERSARGQGFADLLARGAIREDIPVLLTDSAEAEAIKLFANTYLALRVAFFNELDTYAELKGLDTGQVIKGVCLDPRIGDHYNNPSFGYGGYCLPKDTKQLLKEFSDVAAEVVDGNYCTSEDAGQLTGGPSVAAMGVNEGYHSFKNTEQPSAGCGSMPQQTIAAAIGSNQMRKEHIARRILKRNPKVVGVYRLAMKTGSDNFRQSALWDVAQLLLKENLKVILYEPTVEEDVFRGLPVIKELAEFKRMSDVIVANRMAKELVDVQDKVYTRDIYNRD